MQTGAQLGVQTARPVAGRFRQPVVPVHAEMHPLYGPIDITAADIAEMVANWHAGVKLYQGKRSPVEIRHDDDNGAAGWVTSVFQGAYGWLWAEGEYTPSGVKAIEDETFPFISPNLWDEWTDPVTGITHRNVFDGFSLEVRPQFRTLPPATVQHYTEDPQPTVIVVGPAAKHTEEIMADETVAVEETAAEEAVEETTDEAVEAAADEETTDEAADEAAEVAEEAGEDDGDEDPAATDPMDPAYVGQKAGAQQAAPLQTFSEADAAELAAYRAETVKRFGEQIGGLRFGSSTGSGQGKSVVTPASRERLQQVLASMPRQYSEPVMDAIGKLEFCELGERGAPLQPKVEAAQTFSEADARVAAQLGLDPEDYAK